MLHARLSIVVSRSLLGPEKIHPLTLPTTPLALPYPITLSSVLFPPLSRALFFTEDWLPAPSTILPLPSILLPLWLLLGLFDCRLPLLPFGYRLTLLLIEHPAVLPLCLLSTLLLTVLPLRLPIDSPTCLLFHPVLSCSGALSSGPTPPASLPPSLDPTYHPPFGLTCHPPFDLTLMPAAVVEAVGRRRSKRSLDLNTTPVV